MDSLQRIQGSRRILSGIIRNEMQLRQSRNSIFSLQTSKLTRRAILRAGSPSFRHYATLPPSPSPSSKPIVLDQPDKFRPPSHPQRLVRNPRPRGGGYNQASTETERQTQKTKKYPHMFPNKGTPMYWFLTNRTIHLYITLGTLTLLAFFSLTQSFIKTSPFAHLLPPLNSALFHPISYFQEVWSVWLMHTEYITQQTAESRKQNILDAQKRRLYRRAHGMENLDAEEDQGIDVRGLVSWDDGLTNKERARGGRAVIPTGRMVVEMGGEVGEDIGEFMKKKMARDRGEIDPEESEQTEKPPMEKRKRKLWFGIW